MEGFSKTIVFKMGATGLYRVLIPCPASEHYLIHVVDISGPRVAGLSREVGTALVPKLAMEPGDVHLRMGAVPKKLQKAIGYKRVMVNQAARRKRG